jgi:hypothetical protein
VLCYVGNFRPSWSTETYVAKSFELIGEQLVRLQEDEVDSEQVIQAASRFNAEWVLWTRTWGVKDGLEGGHKMIDALRRKGISTATLSLDLYWGLNREPMLHEEAMWRTDIVFTADGGRQADFERAGINHVWLPPAVFAPDCFRGKAREEFKADVIFVGSCQAYHREWPFRRDLVRTLKEEYGGRFQHWGDARYIRGWDLNDLYASVKVVVGDSLARPRYWSDRVPETIGRGGFLVTPLIEGMTEQGFVENAAWPEHPTVVYYRAGDPGECINKLGRVLQDDFPRQAISERGMELVKSKHTYSHRCRTILDAVARQRAGRERAAVDF